MNNEQEIHSVELSIESAKKHIQTRDSLNSLLDNPDFKAVILEGLFKEECSRLVMLKAAPAMSEEKHQSAIMAQINAIGHLDQHFRALIQMGNQAEKALINDEETHQELLAEA